MIELCLCAYAWIYSRARMLTHMQTYTHTHSQRNGTQPPEGNEISQSAGTWRDL